MIVIPTINQLYNGYKTELESNLKIQIPIIGKSFIRALCAVLAAKDKLIFMCVASIQKNLLVDLADSVHAGGTLERFGMIKLGRPPKEAVSGQYLVSIQGQAGVIIPASTVFKSNDGSANQDKLYVLDTNFTLSGGVDNITLRALEPGLASTLNLNDELTSTSPIAGKYLNGSIVMFAIDKLEVTPPEDEENLEVYRAKIIKSYSVETQGGSASDYRLWASDAYGVAKVYPYVKVGAPNEVNVFVEALAELSSDLKGTPSTILLSKVGEVLETNPNTSLQDYERGRRPVGVFAINVLPVNVLIVTVNITGYKGNNLSMDQTLIQTLLTLEFSKIRPFVSSADLPTERKDTISKNMIMSVIFLAIPGFAFDYLTLKFNGVTKESQLFEQGNIPYLNIVNITI